MGEIDEFEWDDSKDAANQQKHGVELIVAQRCRSSGAGFRTFHAG